MKRIILVLMMFMSFAAKSQTFSNSLSAFKEKKIDSVIMMCAVPFDLSAGTPVDDSEITDIKVLRNKLQKLFKEKYFDRFFKGKRVINDSKKTITYEVKSFNKSGELESESTIIFSFKKGKSGDLKLCGIALAG